MPWFIVPYAVDYAGEVAPGVYYSSRTLAINALLQKVIGANAFDYEGIEVRGNRAIVRAKAETAKVTELEGAFYRLPMDDLVTKLDKVDVQGLNDQLLDMGYAQDEIDAEFPDGLGSVTLKEFINFAQSELREIVYDDKTGQHIEKAEAREEAYKPKDPGEVDTRIDKSAAAMIDAVGRES